MRGARAIGSRGLRKTARSPSRSEAGVFIEPLVQPETRIVAQETSASSATRVRELDGIRGIAVIAVLLEHLLIAAPSLYGPRASAGGIVASGLPRGLFVVMSHGWLGVDMFFVLSGFLITTILLGTKKDGVRSYFGRFYERRALRILPAYLIVLAIMAVAYGASFGYTYVVFCVAFIANYLPLFGIARPNGAGPFWSLAVEEQFYFVWPLLILALDRKKLWFLLAALFIGIPFFRANQIGSHEYTWLRADGLAAGAMLALWFSSAHNNRWNNDRLVAAALALGAAIFLATIPFGGLHGGQVSDATRISEALCVFSALVIFAVSRSGTPASAFLRARFLVVTGDLSYCLYLIHVPLIDGYQAALTRFAPSLPDQLGTTGSTVARLIVVVLAAYALAALSRKFVEIPFQRLGRHGRRPAPLQTTAT